MRKIAIKNEFELMEAFRLGREESLSFIFQQLFVSLCSYALSITEDQPAAEDIAEEALIRVWERRSIFYELNTLKSYLYTTIRNSSVSWLRQNKFREGVKKDIAYTSSEESGYILADMIKAEVMGQMKAQMETLPGQLQTILRQIFFEGKKIREIAAELGISECTVKNHKAKALRELKKHLG